jgi:methylated-DNA-[protein]-cysteine S-methyltransferase
VEYFNGKRKVFDIPLYLVGTDFQKKVWVELQKITYGKTETYASLAEKMGDIKSIRAMATANGPTSISILIPCQRIITPMEDWLDMQEAYKPKRNY